MGKGGNYFATEITLFENNKIYAGIEAETSKSSAVFLLLSSLLFSLTQDLPSMSQV